jgi:hypothetical protein
VEVDEAVRTVARRCLSAYGPATREAFARWFGITSPAAGVLSPVLVVDGVEHGVVEIAPFGRGGTGRAVAPANCGWVRG